MAQQFDKIVFTLILYFVIVPAVCWLCSLKESYMNHEFSGQEPPVNDVFALYYTVKYSGVLRVGPLSDAVTQVIDS